MKPDRDKALEVISKSLDRYLIRTDWWQALLDSRPPDVEPARWLAYLKSKGFNA